MEKTVHFDSPDALLNNLYNKISRKEKFTFFCGFFTCLFTNIFVYTNTCFVSDSIMIYNDSNGIGNGRLLVGPLMELTKRMQLPWVIGLISCILVGLITVFLAKIYQIDNKLSIFILAGIIITSDTLVVSHAYFSSLYIYLFSMLLAIMSVYYSDYKKYGYIISFSLLVISILTYQAFLSLAVGLFIFKIILYENEKSTTTRMLIKRLFKYCSIASLATICYYLIWKIVLHIFGEKRAAYYSYSNLNKAFSLSELIKRIFLTFKNSIKQIVGIYSGRLYFLSVVFAFLCFACFLILLFKNRKPRAQLTAFLSTVCYIFSINLMYFLSGNTTYALTIFSIILPVPTLLYLIEKNKFGNPKFKHSLEWAVSVACIILVLGQAVYANAFYLKMKLNYEAAWSFSTRVIDRLEQTEGFDADTHIIIVGSGYTVESYKENEMIKDIISYPLKSNTLTAPLLNGNALTYSDTIKWFIQQEMDMDLNIDVLTSGYGHSDEISKMDRFPSENSIRWIGDDLIIKF